MNLAILDTDLLSEILKSKDAHVLTMARQYLAEHQRFAFSEMTVYEVVRGMRSKRASQQLAAFLRMVGQCEVFAIDRSVLMLAADLWAEARTGGHPKDDADLIIAATALKAQRTLVTGNTTHYSWIVGLQLADWRVPTTNVDNPLA